MEWGKSDFDIENEQNVKALEDLLKATKPNLYALFNIIEETGTDPTILWYVTRQLAAIGEGSKYGNVTATVENGTVTFVRGEESHRILTPIFEETENNG